MAGRQAGAIISIRFIKVRQEGDKEMKKFMILASMVAIVVAALALPALAQDRSPFGDDRDQQSFEQRFERWEDQADKRGYSEEQASDYYFDRLAHFYGFGNDDRWNDDDNDDRDHWWNDDRNDDDDNDRDWWNDDRRDNDRNNNDDRNNDEVVPAVSQEFDQQAESGDVSQSFNVSNTGDNSNQCAGIQGVANTGNAQNQIGVLQYGSTADDFSFEDSGSSINVSPSNSTSCDQQVNQAASAYYGR
jgi:hypothetical protein